jgi:hypothetical protein
MLGPKPALSLRHWFSAAFLLLGGLTIAPASVHAAVPTETPTTTTVVEPSPAAKKKSPWRGSAITYRNNVSTLSFDKAAEPDYNPTWAMGLELAPRYWFDDIFNVSLRLDASYEITDDDSTTLADEALLGNLVLGAGASRFATIPGAGIDVSGSFAVILPTSLRAQAQTLMFAVAPGIGLAKTFDVLEGLTIGYGLRLTKFFHEFTTAERESPIISSCFAGQGGCESFLNTGLRNTSWRITNGFNLGLSFTDWLSISAGLTVVTDFLYNKVDDDRVSLVTIEPTDNRHALVYDLGVSVIPWSPLTVSAGISTVNPQQRPDGDNYAPFFNRNSAVYLDLRLDVAGMVAALAE